MKKLILVLSLVISSCSYYLSPQSQKAFEDPNGGFSDKTLINLNSVQTVSMKACLQCHSGTTVPDLKSYTSLVKNLDKVLRDVFANQMPPPAQGFHPLNDCQKDLLKTWVDLGAPETGNQLVVSIPSCRNVGPTPPDVPISQMPVDYNTFATKILQVKCLKCHNPQGSDPDASAVHLFPYTELIAHRNLLGTSSSNSKLIRILTATDDTLMPPSDSDEPRLTPEQVDFVKRWIDAGHPEKSQ